MSETPSSTQLSLTHSCALRWYKHTKSCSYGGIQSHLKHPSVSSLTCCQDSSCHLRNTYCYSLKILPSFSNLICIYIYLDTSGLMSVMPSVVGSCVCELIVMWKIWDEDFQWIRNFSVVNYPNISFLVGRAHDTWRWRHRADDWG